jgi:hypothetical protein
MKMLPVTRGPVGFTLSSSASSHGWLKVRFRFSIGLPRPTEGLTPQARRDARYSQKLANDHIMMTLLVLR